MIYESSKKQTKIIRKMAINYQDLFNRKEFYAQEKDVIEIIINWKDKNGLYDLRHLVNLVAPDLDIQEYMDIKGLYVATNILRQEFGLNNNNKPGDFDLIIIPFTKDIIYFERTAVCEVKIVRPTRKNPLRNSNSLGTTQLYGIINDGFPFVGLIHISLTEPLIDQEKTLIDFCTIPSNRTKKIENGKKLKDYLVSVKIDNFQWFSADKQLQRIITSGVPKYAGLLCMGLSKNNNDNYLLHFVSNKYHCFEKGYFNPHKKTETIRLVKNHFEKYPSKYKKMIMRE